MEKKICTVCGKSFAPKTKAQKYCGKSCAAYGRARVRKERKDAPKDNKTRNCEYCGEAYTAKNRNQRFCCLSCASKAEAERRPKKRPMRELRFCPVCGKEVPNRANQIYCSRDCAKEAAKREPRDTTPMGKREKDLVRVRITKTVPVFPEMRPRVGGVYMAERVRQKRGSGGMFYVIREIGPMGLVVRENECVEV